MVIEKEKLSHWMDHFFGYGSWEAKVWFVAYEESGGDLPEEVAERLNYFYKARFSATGATLCDIRELYRHVNVEFIARGFRIFSSVSSENSGMTGTTRNNLFKNLYEYRFGDSGIIHGIWKGLIAFVHGFNGEELPDLLSYQRSTFLKPSSNEALITLYPLPSPHNHAWYYSWLDIPGFGFLRRRHVYEDHVYPERIRLILENIKKYKPEVVLMYDMNNINKLKQSVQEFFPGTKFRMVKGIKQVIPQHHRADLNGTILLITSQTPALKHNRVETGYDWEEMGKRIKN
jgi:hypothetical protein